MRIVTKLSRTALWTSGWQARHGTTLDQIRSGQVRSDQIVKGGRVEAVKAINLMPRASVRGDGGQRKARSGSCKRCRGGDESGARHRPGGLDGLGSHDLHRGEAEGGEGGDRCQVPGR